MSREGRAFSNGTEHEMWSANWCNRCMVDAPFRNGLSDAGCPLILTAMLGEIPAEWIEQPAEQYPFDAYHCVNFKPPGWRDPEPHPKPEPPQDGLFERPGRGTRMLLPLVERSELDRKGELLENREELLRDLRAEREPAVSAAEAALTRIREAIDREMQRAGDGLLREYVAAVLDTKETNHD